MQGNCTDESLMIHPLHDTEGLPSMHAAVLRVELASAHGAGWAASVKSAFVKYRRYRDTVTQTAGMPEGEAACAGEGIG